MPTDPTLPGTTITDGLSQAADAMFMVAAPDEAPLAEDCPILHGELVKQSRAAILAFLYRQNETLTVADLICALEGIA